MTSPVISRVFPEPPVSRKEILRYARCPEANEETLALLEEALREARPLLSYTLCYRIFPLSTEGEECRVGDALWRSPALAKNLLGCDRVLLFAATVGGALDRLIARYSRLSPAKALFLQAIGSERVEALCDLFCKELEGTYPGGVRPRFSPGYGDFSLECQRDFFRLLDPAKHLALSLQDSLLMAPSKSVTAVVGLKKENE